MLDIKLIREKPDLVRQGIKNRGGRFLSDLEEVIQRDQKWRSVLSALEKIRADRNKAADEIGRLKKEKKDASKLIKDMESLKKDFQSKEEEERALKNATQSLLLNLPNLPEPDVPIGRCPEDNKVKRMVGKKPELDFKPRDHHDLGTQLGILDFDQASKLSGTAFAVYKGQGAKLERALANFMLDLHTKEFGYTEVEAPFLVSRQTMTNTGQLPKFEVDLYKTTDDDMFLIPTSEVTLANMVQGEVIDAEKLPMALTSYTPCFRREAGSYGKDVRGLTRNHQFTKVELVRICEIEKSGAELEILTQHAEEVLKRLELPYRVMALCTFDMGFAASKSYDLEVWMPGANLYREISSCSTCGDFQARRLNFKVKKDKKREFGCTLNGSGLAVGRTLAAILENGQQKDGPIKIPKALQPYFGAKTIEPN
jgi:seryl-tRNA synthetase